MYAGVTFTYVILFSSNICMLVIYLFHVTQQIYICYCSPWHMLFKKSWHMLFKKPLTYIVQKTIEARVHRRYKTSSRWKNGVEVVQLKCFEEMIDWHAHWTTDWSAECATKGVMDAGRCKNMLHTDHIYVVKGCMTYMCPIVLNDIYMLLKNIHMLLKKICCLVWYVVEQNMSF